MPLLSAAQSEKRRVNAGEKRIEDALEQYYKQHPQEKVFLHTDQNVYLSGQTIWYKAYAQAYGKPSQLSKILYVRLSDGLGRIIVQDKLPLSNSGAHGNIKIPDSLHTGWYHIEGFTSWMLNDKKDVYNTEIYIQNHHDTQIASTALTIDKKYHIHFFPEGGDLVAGALCNVAFKAYDDDGIPVNISGSVMSGSLPIAHLITVHDGMGSFMIGTDGQTEYAAEVHFPDNTVQRIPLPPAKKSGLNMRIASSSVDEFELRITNPALAEEKKEIFIVAAQNSGLCAAYPLTIRSGINVFRLKKDDFSTGILRLTVFDENSRPLAERLVFVNKYDQLEAAITDDKIAFDAKSKNELTINLKNKGNKVSLTNVSVAVTDRSVGTEPDDNISSHFLMSSELSGNVYHPGYYFKNNSDSLQRQLDLVMLTNGWRRFKWENILNADQQPLKYAVENTQLIAGRIENYRESDHFKVKFMIAGSDSSKMMNLIEPDSKGYFVLKDYSKSGTANVFVDVLDARRRKQNVKVTFVSSGIDTAKLPADNNSPSIMPPDLRTGLMLNSAMVNSNVILKGIDIKARKLTPTEELIKRHNQKLTPDRVYTFDFINDRVPTVFNALDYLIGRVPGLQIYKSPSGGYGFEYRGASDLPYKDKIGSAMPFFYIDDGQVTLDDVTGMQMADIAYVQYAPPPVWFAPMNGGFIGAILVYTKRFDDENVSATSRVIKKYTFNSYAITREFPTVDYSTPKSTDRPDYRTTLYWNHDLVPDKDGNIKISFYNSDKAKGYRIIVQGMDADGKTAYLAKEY